MMELFHEVSQECSQITTVKYSTSFSSAIKLLHKSMRAPIYNIYGFVRFADEIVDTFHSHDKTALLQEYRQAVYEAIDRRISLNPILNSFQRTVHEYHIDLSLVDAFLNSMEMGLQKHSYKPEEYATYIYGSAEVVGLMCLYVFCEGDTGLYEQLEPYARSMGAAFQKINFLRDVKADYEGLQRTYFPGCDFDNFATIDKSAIEADIQNDLTLAYEGIQRLSAKSKFGVYVAYKYYYSLFKKIKRMRPQNILQQRVRIPDYGKAFILAKAGIRSQFNLL